MRLWGSAHLYERSGHGRVACGGERKGTRQFPSYASVNESGGVASGCIAFPFVPLSVGFVCGLRQTLHRTPACAFDLAYALVQPPLLNVLHILPFLAYTSACVCSGPRAIFQSTYRPSRSHPKLRRWAGPTCTDGAARRPMSCQARCIQYGSTCYYNRRHCCYRFRLHACRIVRHRVKRKGAPVEAGPDREHEGCHHHPMEFGPAPVRRCGRHYSGCHRRPVEFESAPVRRHDRHYSESHCRSETCRGHFSRMRRASERWRVPSSGQGGSAGRDGTR